VTVADPRTELFERFVQRLLAERPASVLDVGCGTGRLLRHCRDAGIPARGVESHEESLATLAAEGFEAEPGRAEELPFGDGSFDWVVLHFVPHHLSDLSAGLREALRVARTGVLVAEPWFDPSLPGQALALRVDRWLKVQDRRRGMVHTDCISSAQLLGALPADADLEVRIAHHLILCPRPAGWLEEVGTRAVEELPADDRARSELAELMAEERTAGLTVNGSLIVVLRRSVG